MRRVVVSFLLIIAGILLVLGIIGATLPKDQITVTQIVDKVKTSTILASLKADGHQIIIEESNKQFILHFDTFNYTIDLSHAMLSVELKNNDFDNVLIAVLYDSVGRIYNHKEFDSYSLFTRGNLYNYTLAKDGFAWTPTTFKIDILKEPIKGSSINQNSVLEQIKDKLSLLSKNEKLEIKINQFIDETLAYLNDNASSSVNYPTNLKLEELPVSYKPSSCKSIKGTPTFNFTECLFENQKYNYIEGKLQKVE